MCKPGDPFRGLTRWGYLFLALVFLSVLGHHPQARADDALRLSSDTVAQQERVRAVPAGWEVERTRYLELQYPPSERGRARQLMHSADDLLEEVSDAIGVEPSRLYVVRFAGDAETFARVQPGRPPIWASGTAYPQLGLMVLRTRLSLSLPGRGLETTFTHEAVHLLLGEVFMGRPIPRWLNEGLARFIAREVSLEEWTLLSQAILVRGLIPFPELETTFPIGARRAELAYGQSREFLSYLTGRFGPDFLPRLLKRMGEGALLNDALWDEVHHGLTALEEDWRTELYYSFAWLAALVGGGSVWAVMAVLLVLAYARRKYQSRVRRERWAQEEALVFNEEIDDGVPLPSAMARLRVIPGGLAEARASQPNHRPSDEPPESGEAAADDDWAEDEDSDDDVTPQRHRGRRPLGGKSALEGDDDGEERPPPGGWLH